MKARQVPIYSDSGVLLGSVSERMTSVGVVALVRRRGYTNARYSGCAQGLDKPRCWGWVARKVMA